MTTSLPDLPPCAPARIAPLGAQHALFGGWLIPRRTVRSTVPHGKCCFRPRVSGFDHAFAGVYRPPLPLSISFFVSDHRFALRQDV